LFDAGITLMSGISKTSIEVRVKEAQELVQRSIAILENASPEGQEWNQTLNGGMAKREVGSRASEVLNMLGRELRQPVSHQLQPNACRISYLHLLASTHDEAADFIPIQVCAIANVEEKYGDGR
jgi:hypothetical protein